MSAAFNKRFIIRDYFKCGRKPAAFSQPQPLSTPRMKNITHKT
jgi:hypothetical protein